MLPICIEMTLGSNQSQNNLVIKFPTEKAGNSLGNTNNYQKKLPKNLIRGLKHKNLVIIITKNEKSNRSLN